MRIFNKSNTCYSQFYKGYSSFLIDGTFPNISNPNICYNTIKLDEQKDILDCGLAKIYFNYGQNKYNIQTCYFMPNNKISPNMLDFYRRSLIEEMWGKDGPLEKSIKNTNQKNINERKLQEKDEISFEMTIQDKNGKLIKMDSKSYNITIIENDNGNNPFKDEEDEDNSEPEKFDHNNSSNLKFNLLIFIYLILLCI